VTGVLVFNAQICFRVCFKSKIDEKMKKENLDNLISNFYDAGKVESVKEDIRIGDEIIASADKLAADPEVISKIKRDISKHLRSRQGRRMHMTSLRAAIAAMIVLVGFVGIRTIIHTVDPLPEHASRSFFWGEDATASSMSYELDEMGNTMISISLGEEEREADDIIDSLELEIMEDGGGFW